MESLSTADAAERWNELLVSEPDLDNSIDAWRETLIERGLAIDGRPLCTVARPHLVSAERLGHQSAVAEQVLGAGHKAVFALLTEERPEFGLDATERAAIRAHVPWARVVFNGCTTGPGGEEVDLVEHMREHRRQLVLKPAHEFGGHGVVLGWCEDDSAWEQAIETALEAEYVVQHRVELHREDYPLLERGAPLRKLYEDTDPFMFRGEFGGQLTRLSGSEITNVHADGCVCASVAVTPIQAGAPRPSMEA